MLRRLHSRIIGLGSVCGLPPSPPAEVFLKSLPPPSEIDPARYARFQAEERHGPPQQSDAVPSPGPARAPEPFFPLVAGAAGHKHVALLTRRGCLVTFGENRYGQTAAPRREAGAGVDGSGGSDAAPGPRPRGLPTRQAPDESPDWAPLYVDLGDTFLATPPHPPADGGGAEAPAAIACGSNFTMAYQPGGRRVVAFGNNHVGQLGVGHKNRVDAERGFEAWNPLAPWWPASSASVIARIVSGYNHSVVQLSCGALFAFGSNTWGELSIGSTTSPMHPARITFFEKKGARVRKVAAGNSFTLFLTEEGRVYGCGATNLGQLPSNSFEPVPIPLVRSYVEGGSGGQPTTPPRAGSSEKLIRIRDIACVGSLAAYVSVGNELFVQGSLPEYGVATHAPRLTAVDPAPARDVLKARMAGLGWAAAEVDAPDGFDIVDLVGGASTLLVRFRNGCVAGLGANTEGQLRSLTKSMSGRAVNLAPAFSSTSLMPVFAPSPAARGVPLDTLLARTPLLPGSGFTLLIDNDEVYPVMEQVRPIELPPGRAHRQRAPAGDWQTPAGGKDRGRAAGGPSRRERLVASLR